MNAPLRRPIEQASPPASADKVSVLDRMVWLASREADRIAVWQRTGKNGEDVPMEGWDARQRIEHKLFKDMAQLVRLVSMVEPDFRKLVTAKLGNRPTGKKRPGEKDGKPLEEAPDDDAERPTPD